MNLSRIYQVQVPTVVVSIVMSSTHLKPLFISSSDSSVNSRNKAAFDLHLCKKMESGVTLKND